MDKAFRDPTVLDRPVGDVMEPPLPMVGDRRTRDRRRRARSTARPAVLVLDGGHPVGVLTRQDVLAFPGRGRGRRRDRMP